MVLFLTLLTSVVGCGSAGQAGAGDGNAGKQASEAGNDTLAQAKQKGSVTVGFANEKPYAYKTSDGQLTGEAVEIARVVLGKLGINEMKGELTEFGSLIGGLQAKRFDMITAGMFINPQRCQAVLFANPEYSIGEAIAVQEGNPHKLRSYQDIANNKEAKVAVMTGAIEIGYLEKSGVAKEQMVLVPDQASALNALQANRAQAVTMTGPALQAMLDSANDSKLERVADFEQPLIDSKSVRGYGATAFRPEDKSFQEAFNAELKKLKDSGELLEILQKFGFTEQELPGDMTSEALCKEQ
ncbi:ectoine/hydroxyectoine ABC transporter substrate-binding protein EhuB [Paenibacillus doosanensis]|uniref:Amino-acid ABC transporter-binding protein n=1 Tax=Paenibacillus konkukensis TaxID=2020716 RepID=A0ABY4RMD7_9BACL|nr:MULTISPECIES: ectoine/hydroxyectoine ABC transporter substrate-binding protein EhuB [Paenibacillus]MCS7461714.1 ectoine/hydroxyectoine ABC transporter substrate-binding protein EhuB [Paenibacillus doosanensis]UQZ83556.1 putative amino-acid ABC transporter-binding protein precursor [Paenibacillus konkukensis]